MPYTKLMHRECVSDLGHKFLYGLTNYFDPTIKTRKGLFAELSRGTPCESLFRKAPLKSCVKTIMSYINTGGDFKNERIESKIIDCPRFFLRVLDVLMNVEYRPEMEDDEFWEQYGLISEQAFIKIIKKDVSKFHAKVLSPLLDRFRNNAKWATKASITKGFKTTAGYSTRRDALFWKCVSCYQSYIIASCICFLGSRVPKPLEDAVIHLIDIWWILTQHYASDPTVKIKATQSSVDLLELAEITQLPLDIGLVRIKESLEQLDLPTVDNLAEQSPNRSQAIQMALAKLGHRLILITQNSKGVHEWKKVKDVVSDFFPYLWGTKRTSDRRIPTLKDGQLVCSDRKSEVTIDAKIVDICGKSCRAVRVNVKKMALASRKKQYVHRQHVKMVHPTLKFKYLSSGRIFHSNKCIVRIPYQSLPGRQRILEIPCHHVLRVEPGDNQESMSLVAYIPKSERRSMPAGWCQYVNGLKNVR